MKSIPFFRFFRFFRTRECVRCEASVVPELVGARIAVPSPKHFISRARFYCECGV